MSRRSPLILSSMTASIAARVGHLHLSVVFVERSCGGLSVCMGLWWACGVTGGCGRVGVRIGAGDGL